MNKADLINTACDELLSYGLWDRITKIKRCIKKYVLRKQIAEEDLIFWPTGLLAAGLWHCRGELADAGMIALQEKTDAALSEYFARWEKRHNPIFYLDDLLAGEVFLAACKEYEKNKADNAMSGNVMALTDIIHEKNVKQYQAAVEKLADYAFHYPTDETGSFPYRAGQKNGHVYVDAIGMACPFLYEYGRFYEKDEGMELAVKQIANFLAYGIDAPTGLPYHGYDMATGNKYGIIGWGRAVGWLLRGMLGCMSTVYGAARLQGPYQQLVDAAITWQRKDGYFSWQLQAMEGPVDTSATGMICYALQEGLRTRQLQGEGYQNALEKGIHAIQKSMKKGRIEDCLGECEGFSMYPQLYGAYPWALGVALMLDLD